jgi:hypothetical protein
MVWPFTRSRARDSPARPTLSLFFSIRQRAVALSANPAPPCASSHEPFLHAAVGASMKMGLFRTIEVLLSVVALAIAVDLFLMLYFGGYSLLLSFMTIRVQNLAPPVILLMSLILLRVFMKCCASTGKILSAHIPVIIFSIFLIVYLANGVTKASG